MWVDCDSCEDPNDSEGGEIRMTTFSYGGIPHSFGFNRTHLHTIAWSIEEYISYQEQWVDDDRQEVVKSAMREIETARYTLDMVNHYIVCLIKKEKEEEEE